MIDTLLDQVLQKGVEYCSKEENRKVLEDTLLVPIIQHISVRFAWLLYSFQTMALLLLIQTCLVVYLVFKIQGLAKVSPTM